MADAPASSVDAFDIQGARAAGYSDDEILNFLSTNGGLKRFNIPGAQQAGYSPTEILNHVAGVDKRSGPLDAIQQGVSDLASGVGETFGSDTLKKAGAAIAPKNYDSATEHVMHPQNGESRVGYLPRAVLEGAPGLAADLSAGVAGGALGEAVAPEGGGLVGFPAAATASYFARNYGPALRARVAARTGNPDAEPSTADKVITSTATGAEGLLGSLPAGMLARGAAPFVRPFVGPALNAAAEATGIAGVRRALSGLMTTAATQGGVNTANNAISEAARTVGTDQPFDTSGLAGSALLGIALGTTFGARGAAKDAVSSVRFRENGGELADASTQAANRIVEHAGDADALSNPKAAYAATAASSADVARELTVAAKALRKVTPLSTEADNAIARARTGQDLSASDLRAVDDATGGVLGGEAVNSLVKQATTLARLRDAGNFDAGQERFSGGLAERARALATHHPLLSGGSVVGSVLTGHLSPVLAGALGAYAATRGVESALGITSPARAFVQTFGTRGGVNRVAMPVAANEPTDAQYAAADRANAVFDRRAQAEQVRDATQQMQARRSNADLSAQPALQLLRQLKLRQDAQAAQDSQYDAANRANDVFDRRATREQITDAREQMAARRVQDAQYDAANRANATMDRQGLAEQQRDASALMAARRANAPAPAPDQLTPLLKALAVRARVERQNQRADAQAVRAQVKDATDLMAARRANDTFAGQRSANGERSGADTIDEVPVPSGLLHTEVSPQDHAVARQATDEFVRASSPPAVVGRRYYGSVAMKQARIRDRLLQMSAEPAFPADDVALGEALNNIRNLRSREAVNTYVSELANSVAPEVANVVRRYLGPRWTASIWGPKR